jgi:hypothetical protein
VTRFHPTFLPVLLPLLIPWPTIGQPFPVRIVSAKYAADYISVTVQNGSDRAIEAFWVLENFELFQIKNLITVFGVRKVHPRTCALELEAFPKALVDGLFGGFNLA